MTLPKGVTAADVERDLAPTEDYYEQQGHVPATLDSLVRYAVLLLGRPKWNWKRADRARNGVRARTVAPR